MYMFYRVMGGIYQIAANLLSYIPTKYYRNRSTSDFVIVKSKRVNFFLKHSVVYVVHDDIVDCDKGIWTLEILKQYLYGHFIYCTNSEITNFVFYKNCFI